MRYLMLTRAALAAAVISALAVPVPAHAQFGKLLKKAKHAVDPATPDKTSGRGANGAPVHYDERTLELDATRVGKFVDGLQAKLHVLSTADGIGVVAMNERAQKIEQQLPTVDSQKENAYNGAVRDQKDCMENTLDTLGRSHQAEVAATALVMAYDRQKAIERGTRMQRMQEARQRGDTAQANRLQREMQRETMAPYLAMAHKDSVEALKRCGPVPVKPADLATYDSLSTTHEQLIERIRAVENEADSIAAERSGMTREQFDVAKERILPYLGRDQNGLGKAELAALDARHDDIERLAQAIHKQDASW